MIVLAYAAALGVYGEHFRGGTFRWTPIGDNQVRSITQSSLLILSKSPLLVQNDFLYLIGCQVYATDGEVPFPKVNWKAVKMAIFVFFKNSYVTLC